MFLFLVDEIHLGVYGLNIKIQAEFQPLLPTLAACFVQWTTYTPVHGGPVVKHDTSRELDKTDKILSKHL